MEKLKRSLIWLSALFFLTVGVFSFYRFVFPLPGPSTPTPPPPDWFTNWLQNPTCQPPCWQGITPGTTKINEAAEILKSLSWIKIAYGPGKLLPSTDLLTIEWDFTPPSRGGGKVYFRENGPIMYIVMGANPSSTPIKDVIEHYGFPSDVLLDCGHGKCQTNLIYMNSGLRVVLSLDWHPDATGDVTITPDDEVVEIGFFEPGMNGFLTAYPKYSQSFPRWSSPWTGYSKYSEYKK